MLPLQLRALRRRNTFTPPPTALERQLVPVLSTMVGSLLPAVPVIAVEPALPPLGLMVLIAWRLLRGDIWPLWAGLPLGLWDDLFSGAPIGTAICGWTAILLAIDLLDRRLQWRNHRQDWGIAILAIGVQLLLALLLASGLTTSPRVLLPQFAFAALLFPLVARLAATLDRWRFAR